MTPTVQVFVPVYNGDRFLEPCLSSILAQTYASIEIIVVDNRSTDQTAAIVQRMADPRIVYRYEQTHVDLAGNLNRCFDYATAPLFCIVHADDMLHPEYVATMVAAMEAHPSATVAFPRGALISDSGQPMTRMQHRLRGFVHRALPLELAGLPGLKQLCSYNHFVAPAAFFRTAGLSASARFDRTYTYLVDQILWIRILLSGGRLLHVDRELYIHRIHQGQLSANHRVSLTKYDEFATGKQFLRANAPPDIAGPLLTRWRLYIGITLVRDLMKDAAHLQLRNAVARISHTFSNRSE
jgi:glycosyltransferase involved in cell wall biosynthesis